MLKQSNPRHVSLLLLSLFLCSGDREERGKGERSRGGRREREGRLCIARSVQAKRYGTGSVERLALGPLSHLSKKKSVAIIS